MTVRLGGDVRVAAVRVVRVGHQRMRDEVEEGVPQQPPRREAEQQPQQRLVPRGVGLQRDEEEEEVRRRADHQGGAQRLQPQRQRVGALPPREMPRLGGLLVALGDVVVVFMGMTMAMVEVFMGMAMAMVEVAVRVAMAMMEVLMGMTMAMVKVVLGMTMTMVEVFVGMAVAMMIFMGMTMAMVEVVV